MSCIPQLRLNPFRHNPLARRRDPLETQSDRQFADLTGLVCITPQSIERSSTHGAIIAVGERFPAFILPNEHGEPFDLYAASLSKDP